MTITLKVIAVIALAYGALLGLVFWYQPKLVYFPMKGDYTITPRSMGLAFEPVTLPTADGEQLAAWWVPASAAAAVTVQGTVLLFHGNAGNISHRIDYAKMFHDLGYNTLLVDYRGYGNSTGEPSEQGTYRDAAASWQWLTATRGIKASDIVIFGESLGGGVAAWLATQHAPRALILASTFSSIPDLGAQVYPWLPVRWLSRIHYDNAGHVQKMRVTLLIAHSIDDELIPFAHGKKLFAAAPEPKTFLEMRGGHNEAFVFAREAWVLAVWRFLQRTRPP